MEWYDPSTPFCLILNTGRGRIIMSGKICKVEGCHRTDIEGYGYCRLHYRRSERTVTQL